MSPSSKSQTQSASASSPSDASSSSSRPWPSLVSVFAPTIISLACMRWGGPGLDAIESLLTSAAAPAVQVDTTAPHQSGAAAVTAAVEAMIDPVDQLREKYVSEGCPSHQYRTNLFSIDPLITYVENFLSPAEIEYLLATAVPLYQQSPVSKGYRLKEYDYEIRSSMSAVLPHDPVVGCIERRSSEFHGWLPQSNFEDIQVVKYGIADHFRPHYDWFEGMENPRLSTIFVYLACDSGEEAGEGECKGGATQFPKHRGRFPAKWCEEFVDCQDESGVGGVAFKPVVGNAVFWSNVHPNGTGHEGTWHAGMPVSSGRKVGLNIFARRDQWK